MGENNCVAIYWHLPNPHQHVQHTESLNLSGERSLEVKQVEVCRQLMAFSYFFGLCGTARATAKRVARLSFSRHSPSIRPNLSRSRKEQEEVATRYGLGRRLAWWRRMRRHVCWTTSCCSISKSSSFSPVWPVEVFYHSIWSSLHAVHADLG